MVPCFFFFFFFLTIKPKNITQGLGVHVVPVTSTQWERVLGKHVQNKKYPAFYFL